LFCSSGIENWWTGYAVVVAVDSLIIEEDRSGRVIGVGQGGVEAGVQVRRGDNCREQPFYKVQEVESSIDEKSDKKRGAEAWDKSNLSQGE